MDEYNILRKKSKKSGFAATALLTSLAVILLLVGLFVFLMGKVNKNGTDKVANNITSSYVVAKSDSDGDGKCTTVISCNTKEQVFNENLRIIKDAAVSYFTNERLPQKVGEKKTLTLKKMQSDKLVLSVIDSNGKTCDTTKSYVEVTKEKNEYVMKINLSCSDMEDYIVIHLGCYDYCKDNVCEKEINGVTEFEYEYKKITNCEMTAWSKWGEWKTTREKTSQYKKEDTKVETSITTVVDTIDAVKENDTYNCDKYGEDYKLDGDKCIKTIESVDVVDATPSTFSYNCDKYGEDYKLDGDKCVKTTTKEEVIDATKNDDTYSCPISFTLKDKKCERVLTIIETKDSIESETEYTCKEGYKLDGNKCYKMVSKTDEKEPVKEPITYTCASGYKRDDITYTVKSGDTLASISKAKNISVDAIKKVNNLTSDSVSVGTKLSLPSKYQTVCYKSVNDTVTIDATPIEDIRYVAYTCNKVECTTETVLSCEDGNCGMVPQTSCETVPDTCYYEEPIITGYTCPDNTYTLVDDKCSKATSVYDYKDAIKDEPVYTCEKDYTLTDGKCIKTYEEKEEINATKKPATYSCEAGFILSSDNKCVRTYQRTEIVDASKDPDSYSCKDGYKLNGNKCEKTVTETDTKEATKVEGGYVCDKGYTLNETKCEKTIVETITEEATKVEGAYVCPEDYELDGTTCTRERKEEVQTTYYRYATRTCEGGSTDIKWSTKDDKDLLNAGYKMTGNKREIVEK